MARAAAYLLVLRPNVPARVLVATGRFLLVFVAAVRGLPELPFWVYLLWVPVFYKLQSWSHKIWTAAADMTEFNKKYTKGSVLFVLLLFYEVPLVLNYLVFGRNNWSA